VGILDRRVRDLFDAELFEHLRKTPIGRRWVDRLG
jgi:hypothetical protein